MDESDIDNDSGSEDDQSVTEEEQLLIAAAAVEKRDQQLTSLLERKNELPLRTRNKFDALVFELLMKTKEDIHEMICDNTNEDDNYQGLDSSRDTEAEVETAIRFFPEVISQTYGEDEQFPIQQLCLSNEERLCNVKAVSFIALLARLAIEFHSFEDHERGGLLIKNGDGHNIFNSLMWNFSHLDHDDLVLTLLIRLRRMGLFKKDDIRDYSLVSSMFGDDDFPERVFQFLVEWDPTSLIRTSGRWFLFPLYWAAARKSIREFQIIFGYGIRYYPVKKGISLLFQKSGSGCYYYTCDTPFQYACQKYGRERVMGIVEETLTHYHSEGTPLHIVEALMEAAADENVHLDCSYFLLRREPDVLVRLLSGPHNNNDDGGGDGGGGGNQIDGNDVDDDEDHDEDKDGDGVGSDGDGDIGNSKNNRAGTRKRKRGEYDQID